MYMGLFTWDRYEFLTIVLMYNMFQRRSQLKVYRKLHWKKRGSLFSTPVSAPRYILVSRLS